MHKLRTMTIALIAGLAISATARAGDISSPVAKAIPFLQAASPCTVASATTPLSCTGPYIGGGIAGQGSNANIIGSGVQGSLFAGGMTPTFDVGYQYAKGNWFFAPEFDGGYAVGTNGTAAPVNGIHLTEIFKLGGNLSALLGNQQAPITIPAQLANAIISPYVAIGQAQWQLTHAWANGTVGAAGVVFDIGPQWFGDLRYSYTDFSAAKSKGIVLNNDNSIMLTANYKFK